MLLGEKNVPPLKVPRQCLLVNWLGFVAGIQCVYREVRTEVPTQWALT
jgi:hypothetical protein